MGKKKKMIKILADRKFWLRLLGVVAIGAVIYYGISFTNKSSAFGIIEPGNIPTSLNKYTVYVSNSGDNDNTGLSVQAPVRDIRRAVEVANQFSDKLVTVKFMESQFLVGSNDPVNQYNPAIQIYNPRAVSFRPNDGINKVVLDSPYGYGLMIIDVASTTQPVLTQGLMFDGVGSNHIALQISGNSAQVIVKNGIFTGPTSAANQFQLQVTSSKSAEIITNNFSTTPPIINAQNDNRVMSLLKLAARDNKPSYMKVTQNIFTLPADYSESYSSGQGLTQVVAILAMTGPVQIFGNTFKTAGINNYINKMGILPRSGNLHNIGVITGYESRGVEITNNDFAYFDGLDMLSRAHVEEAYNNTNKQSVFLRDNYIWKE